MSTILSLAFFAVGRADMRLVEILGIESDVASQIKALDDVGEAFTALTVQVLLGPS